VKEIQLVLKQPSPHWIKFGLADLKCFAGMEETDAVRLHRLPSIMVYSIASYCPPFEFIVFAVYWTRLFACCSAHTNDWIGG